MFGGRPGTVIRAAARQNEMIDTEKLSHEELDAMMQTFDKIRRECESRGGRQNAAMKHKISA